MSIYNLLAKISFDTAENEPFKRALQANPSSEPMQPARPDRGRKPCIAMRNLSSRGHVGGSRNFGRGGEMVRIDSIWS